MTAAQIKNSFSHMLAANDFKSIGSEGLGNPRSRVAGCVAYFRDHIYLGVTHHKGLGAGDRARILRFDPAVNEWEECYQSPLVYADERPDSPLMQPQAPFKRGRSSRRPLHSTQARVPKYRGFGSMTVFQGAGDSEPALYVSPICQWGAQILRSEDGRTFTAAELGIANQDFLSCGSLTGFNGKLFCSPASSVRGGLMGRTVDGETVIYVTDDPLSGTWEQATEASFGDATNKSISCLAVFNNFLYASVGNPSKGFQLWKTNAAGTPPYAWQPVLTDGAQRFNRNETAPSMAVFQDALFIGSGLPGLGRDSVNDVGPAACELLRVYPDDSWDLLVGEPRFTTDGLKVPFSCMGPGFDDFYNSVIWAIEVHDGWLYAGTQHWKIIADRMRGQEATGGFQLWRSQDGENWEAVTLDGFHQPYEVGARTLMSTPLGLVLGTCNHTKVSQFARIRRDNAAEMAGDGCQVWLGRHPEVVIN